MARAIKEIENETRSPPLRAQERLLCVLLEELDGPDPDAESAWLKEVQCRGREVDEGLVESVPAEKVFAKLSDRLKTHGG